MKSFKVNEELIEILKKNNFIETSSERDIKKGKKSFKQTKHSKRQIYFDYTNIVVFDGSIGQQESYELNEKELKILILYFKLKSSDLKEITRDFQFKFSEAIKCFGYLKEELENWKRLNRKKPRIGKLERIIGIYNEIKL